MYRLAGIFLKGLVILIVIIICSSIIVVNREPIDDAESVPILMYHNIVKENDIRKITYSMEKDRFETHMEFLRKKGYNPIGIDEFKRFIYNEKKLPKNPIMITFDDGKYNNYKNAYPIMKKHGIIANMFLIGKGLEESRDLNTSELADEYKYYFGKKEIAEMKKYGFEFGAHTFRLHNKIGSESLLIYRKDNEEDADFKKRIEDDLTLSKEIVEEYTEKPCISIAYPYGIYDETALDLTKKAKFKIGFSTNIGVFRKGDDPYTVKRINIDGFCSKYRLVYEIEILKLISKLRK